MTLSTGMVLASLFSPFQPFRFGRTARDEDGFEQTRRSRHPHLFGHPLMST
jgi:hypothetical protein